MKRRFAVPSAAIAVTVLGTGALIVPALTSAASAAPTGQTQGQLVSSLGLDKTVATSKHGTYVVLLKSDPLLGEFSQSQLSSSAAAKAQQAIVADHNEILSDAKVPSSAVTQDLTVAANGFSVETSHAAAMRLAADPKVAAVVPDELRTISGVESSAATSLAAVNTHHDRGRAALPTGRGHKPGSKPGKGYKPTKEGKVPTEEQFLNLTGKGEAYDSKIDGTGVLVGVIDTGIWPEHPSFADDGTLPAAPDLGPDSCDFGNTAANKNDAAFTCNNKLVGARDMTTTYRAVQGAEPDEFVSARDDEGHGTHTASTAAGDANVKATIDGHYVDTTTGIAPRAQVIAYKALGNEGGFSSDLSAAIDQAVADGVGVINYSVGGGANLLGPDAISFLFASDAGVFASVSAGNDGPGESTLGGPADSPWVTAVAAGTEPRFYRGTIKLGNGTTLYGASVTKTLGSKPIVDAADLGNQFCVGDTAFSASVKGKIVLCHRGSNGRVAKSLTVSDAGGVGMILANVDVPNKDNLFTDTFFVPTVHVDQVVGEKITAYIHKSGSRPATAAIVKTSEITNEPWKAPSVTVFSSRGESPTAASVVKPDITAPGIQIVAGASPYTDAGFVSGELFQAIAGTSMAAPQIAGIYALVKQAHPEWSPAEAKSALQTTASLDVRDNDRVSQATPFERGAGEVNPGVVSKPGMFNPGLVYDAGHNDYLGFYCDAAPGIFTNAASTCATLKSQGVPTRTEDLNLPTIGIDAVVGSETVTRTVTNVSGKSITVRADTKDAPAGYAVSVKPSTLTVAAGKTASFQVTVTNKGKATIGAWRFGNLTWKGSGYTVNSSIAVKAAQVGTSTSVTGEGASGTLTVPVKFGYDGTYQAKASGLVASAPLNGSVTQDPDQKFGTPDDGTGVAKIPVTIGDVAYWRFGYTASGNDDLDLYLLGPDGKVVASSTNGGTDELIELNHPAAGTYTVAVHGWKVTGTHQFSLDNWIVPSTPGSLTVTSAPTSATVNGSGSVALSWTGASPAGTYYGVVDHTDGTQELAQTVVAVKGAN
ncbi:S8 family serine peptidase [Nocardioides sp.]|uniref:S8 family serine peptidase n=1 Tax=Nocardioides sp. TaxID=35761 RepID=UPI00262E74DA|nr:S8 family serine peptidase [Nocardioides sp.]